MKGLEKVFKTFDFKFTDVIKKPLTMPSIRPGFYMSVEEFSFLLYGHYASWGALSRDIEPIQLHNRVRRKEYHLILSRILSNGAGAHYYAKLRPGDYLQHVQYR